MGIKISRILIFSVLFTLLLVAGSQATTTYQVPPGDAGACAWPADGDWTAVASLDDGNLTSAASYHDLVGDASNHAVFIYSNATYVYFRLRVYESPSPAFNTGSIHIFIDSPSLNTPPDYGFAWDVKNSASAEHGLEMQVFGSTSGTWDTSTMDDIDGQNAAKGTNDINGAGRSDGCIRTIDGQATVFSRATTFVDFAVKWNYLAAYTTLSQGQTWGIQVGTNMNANDHNFIDVDVGGGQSVTDPIAFPGSVTWSSSVATTVGDGTSPSDKTVKASDADKAVSSFTLSTNTGTDTVTQIVVTGTNPSNIAANGVNIYLDNGSTPNEYDAGDTLQGTASFSGETATFSSISLPVTTTPTQYIITYDIAASPTNGQTLTAVVTGATATNPVSNDDTVDATLTIDTVSPTLSPVHIASDNTDTTTAVAGDTITLSFTSSEDITEPTVTIAGNAAMVSGGPTDWSATYTVLPADPVGIIAFSISSFSDSVGNAGSTVSATTDGSFVIVLDTCFDTAWERTFDGDSFDYVRGITSDSFGNVFVNGRTSDGYYYDFITIKYDPDGNIVSPWPMTYDSGYRNDYASGVCVDGNDDVYVTGYTNYDFVVVKYANDGTELWAYHDDFGKIEYARSVAVTDSGYFYVAGDSNFYQYPDYDYLTVQYDSTTGDVLWWNTWDNLSNGADDSPRGVAVDSDGNVYVAGASLNDSNNYDAVTVKYNAACGSFDPVLPDKCADSEVWSRAFDRGDDDAGYAIAVDNINGNSYVYVTGDSFNGLKYDLMLIKYDADGTLLWERTFDGGYDDIGLAITIDDYHNIYVAGQYNNGANADFITLKYDSDGVLLNSWFYDSGDDDTAKGITTHGTDVYVTGTYWPGTSGSLTDFVTIKYRQLCDPFRITTPLVSPGTKDVPYSQSLSAVSGVEPYTWSISSGSLPTGLLLNETTGVISGTPAVPGTFNFTALVEDSSLPTPLIAEKSFTVIVSGVSITTSSLSDATIGIPYSQAVSATGWPTPLTWSVISGSLPNGLTLNSSTGIISGTPSLTGSYSFSVQVSTQDDVSESESFTMQIYNPLIITTTTLPIAAVGTEYNGTLTLSGGKSPYTWAVASGALPDGLTLNSSTGIISGTPSTEGLFTFSPQVTDSNAIMAVESLSISVDPLPLSQVAGSPVGYSFIQVAYAAAESGDVVQARSLVFIENLDCNRNIIVTLEGGYNATFTDNSGFTTISGSVTISEGSVTIENVIIQ